MQVVIGTCRIGVRVGLSACHTCYVGGMRYWVCALCRCMYYVALYIGYRCKICVLYRVYVYAFEVSHIVCRCMSCDVHCACIPIVLCQTPDVGVCIVLCCKLGVGVCVVCQV